MGSVWKRLNRINKRAAKFHFTASYSELWLEAGPNWQPTALSVIWTRKSRRVVSEPVKWEPTMKNPYIGMCVWPVPENKEVTVTMFRDSHKEEYDNKDWFFILEDVSPSGKRKPVAQGRLNMRDFCSAVPTQSDVTVKLRPVSKKVTAAKLSLTLTSELLREGKPSDSDMLSQISGNSTLSEDWRNRLREVDEGEEEKEVVVERGEELASLTKQIEHWKPPPLSPDVGAPVRGRPSLPSSSLYERGVAAVADRTRGREETKVKEETKVEEESKTKEETKVKEEAKSRPDENQNQQRPPIIPRTPVATSLLQKAPQQAPELRQLPPVPPRQDPPTGWAPRSREFKSAFHGPRGQYGGSTSPPAAKPSSPPALQPSSPSTAQLYSPPTMKPSSPPTLQPSSPLEVKPSSPPALSSPPKTQSSSPPVVKCSTPPKTLSSSPPIAPLPSPPAAKSSPPALAASSPPSAVSSAPVHRGATSHSTPRSSSPPTFLPTPAPYTPVGRATTPSPLASSTTSPVAHSTSTISPAATSPTSPAATSPASPVSTSPTSPPPTTLSPPLQSSPTNSEKEVEVKKIEVTTDDDEEEQTNREGNGSETRGRSSAYQRTKSQEFRAYQAEFVLSSTMAIDMGPLASPLPVRRTPASPSPSPSPPHRTEIAPSSSFLEKLDRGGTLSPSSPSSLSPPPSSPEHQSFNRGSGATATMMRREKVLTDRTNSLLRQNTASTTEELLEWTKAICAGYSNVKVTNFGTSWRDGLAFCAIIHHSFPDLIPYSRLCRGDIKENCKLAFEAAERLGVARLIEPSEMAIKKVPDKLLVITYLHQLRSCLGREETRAIYEQSRLEDKLPSTGVKKSFSDGNLRLFSRSLSHDPPELETIQESGDIRPEKIQEYRKRAETLVLQARSDTKEQEEAAEEEEDEAVEEKENGVERVLDAEQVEVDKQLKILERRLRETSEDDQMVYDALLQQWLTLVNQKNALLKRQDQLNLLDREADLEKKLAMLQEELRALSELEEGRKTEEDRRREDLLLEELVLCVKSRDQVVMQQDEEERNLAEDEAIDQEVTAPENQRLRNNKKEDCRMQ